MGNRLSYVNLCRSGEGPRQYHAAMSGVTIKQSCIRHGLKELQNAQICIDELFQYTGLKYQ
jgi:hypothetical protein